MQLIEVECNSTSFKPVHGGRNIIYIYECNQRCNRLYRFNGTDPKMEQTQYNIISLRDLLAWIFFDMWAMQAEPSW